MAQSDTLQVEVLVRAQDGAKITHVGVDVQYTYENERSPGNTVSAYAANYVSSHTGKGSVVEDKDQVDLTVLYVVRTGSVMTSYRFVGTLE